MKSGVADKEDIFKQKSSPTQTIWLIIVLSRATNNYHYFSSACPALTTFFSSGIGLYSLISTNQEAEGIGWIVEGSGNLKLFQAGRKQR